MENLENNLPVLQADNLESLTDLNDYLRNNVGLKIMHINIRSMSKNFDKLRLCLNSMPAKPDLLICTETFKIDYPNFFEIENYVLYCVNSEINRNDGSCIYVKKDIEHINREIYIGKTKANFTVISTNMGKLNITSLYRSHGTAVSEFIRDLQKYLQSEKNMINHFIVGDINIDILKDNPNVHEYLNNYLELGFNSLINIPTRITLNTISCIDHIFSNSELGSQITPLVCDLDLTDHLSTMIIIDKCSGSNNLYNDLNYKNKLNYNKLINLVANLDWNCVYNEMDVNLALDIFVDEIKEALNKSTIKVKINNKNKPRKEWITKSLIISCKNKNLLYKKLKSNPDKIELKNKYIEYKRVLDTLIKKAKLNYFDQIANKLTNNTKALWKFLNDKINRGKGSKKSISQIYSDSENRLLDNETDIANYFNKFFAEIGPEMAAKFELIENNNVISHSIRETIFLTSTCEAEILKIINEMDAKKQLELMEYLLP